PDRRRRRLRPLRLLPDPPRRLRGRRRAGPDALRRGAVTVRSGVVPPRLVGFAPGGGTGWPPVTRGPPMQPLVGVIMGSRSDWETMRHAAATLEELGVPHEVRVVSAHRTPDLLFQYADTAAARGLE